MFNDLKFDIFCALLSQCVVQYGFNLYHSLIFLRKCKFCLLTYVSHGKERQILNEKQKAQNRAHPYHEREAPFWKCFMTQESKHGFRCGV